MTHSIGGLETIHSSLADDPDLGELVALFVDEMRGRVDTLERYYYHRDWPALERAAHQLKGAGGSHGFDEVTLAAARLETALRQRMESTRIVDAFEALVDVCLRVRVGSAD